MESAKPFLHDKLKDELYEFNSIKFHLAVQVKLEKEVQDNSVRESTAWLRTKQNPIQQKADINLDSLFGDLQTKRGNYQRDSSNWRLQRVEAVSLDIARHQPLRGSSYIDLPSKLKNKKATTNVNNNDNDCLRWSLRAALFPVDKHPQRCSSYPKDDGLDFSGISSPTPISEISRVESQNNLAINVFGWDGVVTVFKKQ